MKKIKNIFVVLTYINSKDLERFIVSVKSCTDEFHIIVVNSYYDEESKSIIEKIAIDNSCDFLNIANKGYSYGNNRGIDFALQNYDFDFLIVSNADIIVRKFNTVSLNHEGIYCGVLKNKKGKHQNPMLVYENPISDQLIYEGYKEEKKWKLVIGIGMNMAIRKAFLCIHSGNRILRKIFQPHGSFIVFSKRIIETLYPVFDENVFLFGEEGILAKRAKSKNIKIYYSDFAICDHNEDGSMGLSDLDLDGECKKSNIYYYENYCK